MRNILDWIALFIIIVLFIAGLIGLEQFLDLWIRIFIGVIFVGILFYVARHLFGAR